MNRSNAADRGASLIAGDHGDQSSLLHLLIEQIVDYAIFVLDKDGNIASWNPGAERIKGYAATRSSASPTRSSSRGRSAAGKPDAILRPRARRTAI